jgi:predicted alpha/beta hydrolase family esterase
MLARLLAVTAIAQWVLAALLGVWLLTRGMPIWLVLPALAALLLAVHGVPLAIEFFTGAIIDRRMGPRLSPVLALRLWWRETWVSATLFGWFMPFRSRFPEPHIVRDPARPAVLLIHGFACNRAVWKPLLDSGRLAAYNVATVNLEPVFGAIDHYGDVIRRAIEALRARSGAARITLVCHSMGGLAARVYVRDAGLAAVDRVITVATPHAGTVFATFGHGHNAWQMRVRSEFLAQLQAATTPVAEHFVCIASRDDNLIVPRASLWLPGASHVAVERVGHLAMLSDDKVLDLIAQELVPGPGRAAPAMRELAA